MQKRETRRSLAGRGRLATVGTLASAGLVASHCLGPVVFLLFGTTVGALSALAALERYRPWFIAAGFAFWSYGAYRLYFGSPVGAGGAACSGQRPLARTRTLLWVGLGVLLIAIVLPKLALYFAS